MATTEPQYGPNDFRVMEAFSRWGDVEGLFDEPAVRPDSISEELRSRVMALSFDEKNILGLIWSLSALGIDPRDIALYGDPIRNPPHSSSPRGMAAAAKLEMVMGYIGHELVSDDVRMLALNGNHKLARHLRADQLEALVGKLDGFTVSMLLTHELLGRTETVARRIIGALFGENPMAYSDAVGAFGHGAIIDAVKDDDEFSQLIRLTTTSQAASAKLFLHSEHFRPFHFLDLVAHFEGRQLLRFLEHASGALQSDSKFKLAADAMLKHRAEPIDETPDPELALKARRAQGHLLSDKISIQDLVKAEAAYRIYRGPYERMVKFMSGEPEAFSKGELDAELFRLIREEAELRLWAEEIRAAARQELEVAGLQASLDAMGQ